HACLYCADDAGMVPRRSRGRSPAAAALHIHGARRPREHVLVFDRRARAARTRRRPTRLDHGGARMTPLAPTLEAFFTDRLLCQQRVSPNTIASYRDTFRLLLAFAQQQTGRSPARLELTQLDATMIGAFLE